MDSLPNVTQQSDSSSACSQPNTSGSSTSGPGSQPSTSGGKLASTPGVTRMDSVTETFDRYADESESSSSDEFDSEIDTDKEGKSSGCSSTGKSSTVSNNSGVKVKSSRKAIIPSNVSENKSQQDAGEDTRNRARSRAHWQWEVTWYRIKGKRLRESGDICNGQEFSAIWWEEWRTKVPIKRRNHLRPQNKQWKQMVTN